MANRTQDAVSGIAAGSALPVGDGLRLGDAPVLGRLLGVDAGVLVRSAVRAAERLAAALRVALTVAVRVPAALVAWRVKVAARDADTDCGETPEGAVVLPPVGGDVEEPDFVPDAERVPNEEYEPVGVRDDVATTY
jgi:hypothetical protein